MSFALSDEQRMIQESARDFAMSEVLPIANEYDPERRDIPESLRAKLAEMGFFGITIPSEYGGLGLGCLEYCLVDRMSGVYGKRWTLRVVQCGRRFITKKNTSEREQKKK